MRPSPCFSVTASTFNDNSATSDGGGICTFPGKGSPAAVTANCTFTANGAASGGAIYDAANASLLNSTLSANTATTAGGGILVNNGTFTVANTILANNAGGNCSGIVADGGNNLDSGATCHFTVAALNNTNPQLDPGGLLNNGGPTLTIALCTAAGAPAGCTAASPALNAASNTVCTNAPVSGVDQRGDARFPPGTSVCDIGAFEAQPALVQVPALSPAGLMALALLLSTAGWLALRRRRMLRLPARVMERDE